MDKTNTGWLTVITSNSEHADGEAIIGDKEGLEQLHSALEDILNKGHKASTLMVDEDATVVEVILEPKENVFVENSEIKSSFRKKLLITAAFIWVSVLPLIGIYSLINWVFLPSPCHKYEVPTKEQFQRL